MVLDPDSHNPGTGPMPSQPWPPLPPPKRKGHSPLPRSLPVLMDRGSKAQGTADAIQGAREQQRYKGALMKSPAPALDISSVSQSESPRPNRHVATEDRHPLS